MYPVKAGQYDSIFCLMTEKHLFVLSHSSSDDALPRGAFEFSMPHDGKQRFLNFHLFSSSRTCVNTASV